MSDERNETIADIVAEMRGAKSVYDRYRCGGADCDAIDTLATISAYADRIEEAWKRETQTYLDQIRDAMNQFGHEKFKSEHAPVGNAAAMREALESCLDFIMRIDRAFNPFMQNLLEDAIAKAKAALSKPPRNCDRFNSEREMQFAFLAELLSMGINGASVEEYSKWLLAEAKGASNESK